VGERGRPQLSPGPRHKSHTMKIDTDDFRAAPGKRVRLARWATKAKPFYKSEKHYRELLVEDVRQLSGLQRMLYASNTYSVLLIFQAMDAAGKDGAIAHVLSGVNPEGCEVFSFKAPSEEESEHDFMWRTTCRLPARGRIGVFNRSYYEEVLIVRVHPEILRAQRLPPELAREGDIWDGRYRSIVDLERHLHRNGTRVIKFFLHLSKAEQRRRFLERIDDPSKNWKFSMADMKERGRWNDYVKAYEECMEATSIKGAPWHIVPADDKLNARLIVSRIVIEALKGLKLGFPRVTRAQKRELKEIRKRLSR
jgi:PPK2 family polyphosphate:nucleotide phosphotransferase